MYTSYGKNWNANYYYLSLFIQGRRFLQRARVFYVKCFCQLLHLVICVLQCAHNMSLNFCHVLFKIDKKAMKTSGMVARVINEVEIHCQLKHPSILEVYKHALLNPMFYIEQILKIICFFFPRFLSFIFYQLKTVLQAVKSL